MAAKPIPDGYHSVTPYLMVAGAAKLLDFAKQAFGAQEVERFAGPDGKIMHAQIRIGDSLVMVSDAMGNYQPMPGGLYLYVTDVDRTYQQALAAGATSVMKVEDHFYGDRSGGVRDPAGNMWWIATHKEDVSPEELNKRMQAAQTQRAAG